MLKMTKPFDIPKQLFVDAFKHVKTNAGAAGVDHRDRLSAALDLSLRDGPASVEVAVTPALSAGEHRSLLRHGRRRPTIHEFA